LRHRPHFALREDQGATRSARRQGYGYESWAPAGGND
jgi:hypothetical protein